MIETTSANESGLASTASKIAVTLFSSKDTLVSIDSIDSPASVTSLLVATISADKATSNESIDASSSCDKSEDLPSTYCLMSCVFAICVGDTSAQFTVVKKSLICFERICAILFILLYFGG